MLVLFAVDYPGWSCARPRRVLRPGGTLTSPSPNRRFDMATLLAATRARAVERGRLGPLEAPGSLAADWEIVRKVHEAFTETIHESWKAEQRQRTAGGGLDDIGTNPAYGGYCTTIRATKPREAEGPRWSGVVTTRWSRALRRHEGLRRAEWLGGRAARGGDEFTPQLSLSVSATGTWSG